MVAQAAAAASAERAQKAAQFRAQIGSHPRFPAQQAEPQAAQVATEAAVAEEAAAAAAHPLACGSRAPMVGRISRRPYERTTRFNKVAAALPAEAVAA